MARVWGGMEGGLGKRPHWGILSRHLAVMTIHLSYIALKKKSGESPGVEMQTPTCIYICNAWAMCVVIQRTRSCGTENNICLSQVPEEIVALSRRGRAQI